MFYAIVNKQTQGMLSPKETGNTLIFNSKLKAETYKDRMSSKDKVEVIPVSIEPFQD